MNNAKCRQCNPNITDADNWYQYDGNDFECSICGSNMGAVYDEDRNLFEESVEDAINWFDPADPNTGQEAVWVTNSGLDVRGSFMACHKPIKRISSSIRALHNAGYSLEEIKAVFVSAPKRRIRQVRDALNKCGDPELIEKVGQLLGV